MTAKDSSTLLRMLTDFWLGSSISPQKRFAIRASFHHDIEVYFSYLARYAGEDLREEHWKHYQPGGSYSGHYSSEGWAKKMGRVAEVTVLPYLLGLDPREDEVAEWARLFLPKGQHSGFILKAQPALAARRFHQAGVPAQFAATYYRREMNGPQQRLIIQAYQEGVPYEYIMEVFEEQR